MNDKGVDGYKVVGVWLPFETIKKMDTIVSKKNEGVYVNKVSRADVIREALSYCLTKNIF